MTRQLNYNSASTLIWIISVISACKHREVCFNKKQLNCNSELLCAHGDCYRVSKSMIIDPEMVGSMKNCPHEFDKFKGYCFKVDYEKKRWNESSHDLQNGRLAGLLTKEDAEISAEYLRMKLPDSEIGVWTSGRVAINSSNVPWSGNTAFAWHGNNTFSSLFPFQENTCTALRPKDYTNWDLVNCETKLLSLRTVDLMTANFQHQCDSKVVGQTYDSKLSLSYRRYNLRNPQSIECLPDNVIYIEFARYEYRANGTPSVLCAAPNTFTLLRYLCQGKSFCKLEPSVLKSYFGYSCNVQDATLTVQYSCLPRNVTMCPSEMIEMVEFGSKHCVLVTRPKASWNETMKFCQDHGGQLAAFHDSLIIQKISAFVKDLKYKTTFWILDQVQDIRPTNRRPDVCTKAVIDSETDPTNLTVIRDCSGNHHGLCAFPPYRHDDVHIHSILSQKTLDDATEDPTMDTMVDDQIEISPIGKFCPAQSYGGLTWPSTNPGATILLSCPPGQDGKASWTCKANGEFNPIGPDFSNCVTSVTTDIYELPNKLDQEHHPQVVVTELAETLQMTETIASGDIVHEVDLLAKALLVQEHIIQNMTNEEKEVTMNTFTFGVDTLVDTPKSEIPVDTKTSKIPADTPTSKIPLDTPTSKIPVDTPNIQTNVDDTTTQIVVDDPTTETHVADPTTEIHVVNPTEELSIGKYCPPQSYGGLNWPPAIQGTNVILTCPPGQHGKAIWTCESNGKYNPIGPDFSGCVTSVTTNIRQLSHQLDEGIHPDVVVTDLAVTIETAETIASGDIVNAVDLLDKALLVQGQIMENMTNEEKEGTMNTFTLGVVNTTSVVLATDRLTSWLGLDKIHRAETATKLLANVDSTGILYASLLTSEMRTNFEFSRTLHLYIESRNTTHDSQLELPNIVIPSEAFQIANKPASRGKVPIVVATYNTIGHIMPIGDHFQKFKHVTQVIGATLNKVVQLAHDKVSVIIKKPTIAMSLNQHICVFWNGSQWSTDGCKLSDETNDTHFVCKCDHMTSFAVLMSFNPKQVEILALNIITIIGCSVSILCLAACIIAFLVVRSLRTFCHKVHMQLCISLMTADTILIAAHFYKAYHVDVDAYCTVLAMLLHYFYLATFMWMFLEGVQIYLALVRVFAPVRNCGYAYYLIGYGIPGFIVGICAGVNMEGYVSSTDCFLDTESGFIWGFIAFVLMTLMFNTVLVFLSLKSASRLKHMYNVKQAKSVSHWLWQISILHPLLGFTWIFGFLQFRNQLIFSYIFTILNSLQGMFIFLFHVIRNEDVRHYFARIYVICDTNDPKPSYAVQNKALSSSRRTEESESEYVAFNQIKLLHYRTTVEEYSDSCDTD